MSAASAEDPGGALTNAERLTVTVADLDFQNPIVLASGTAGYGVELADVMDLEHVGGLTTKAVSVEPRAGNPAPRVAELDEGMINSVGLANPGLERVKATYLPWLASHLMRTRKIVNVVGNAVEDYARVVAELDACAETVGANAIDAFELNVSCPNVKAGGMEFGADAVVLQSLVRTARAGTRRPLFVKLSPMLPEIARTAKLAIDAGADGLTLVNTLPGLAIDVEHRRPALGFGSGGVSGPGLLPVGVLATWRVSRAVKAPIIGIGGVGSANDALQYMMAGASLVGVGTAAMRDPRAPARIIKDLDRWCDLHGVRSLSEIVGALEWNPA
ncbi:MAG TPA: dihydroorotate dehydrogenase [Gemmatimonadaceae bacterium]|nr:dihydroorotate dehydrogenase [Gemmatimonadaceae bacterium]